MSMRQDQIERCDALWRELADTARVRWMPGMLARNIVDADHPLQRILRRFGAADTRVWSLVWTDPATLGCLLAMLREASDDHRASVVWYSAARQWVADWKGCEIEADSEPEALMLAINEVSRAK
jgi:hypothetical protein